uniref:Uncharacterized protein n=1 Tax=Anopheles culicifacies TaxID=139723 RepID=A0A182MAY0_9DIPT
MAYFYPNDRDDDDDADDASRQAITLTPVHSGCCVFCFTSFFSPAPAQSLAYPTGPTEGISISLMLLTRRCCAYFGSVAWPLSIGGALTRLLAMALALSSAGPGVGCVSIDRNPTAVTPGIGGGADVGGGR